MSKIIDTIKAYQTAVLAAQVAQDETERTFKEHEASKRNRNKLFDTMEAARELMLIAIEGDASEPA